MRKSLLPLFVLLWGFATTASAQWNQMTADNNPVVTTNPTSGKGEVFTVSGSNNSMFVVWSETLGATGSDLYLQKVNALGNIEFPEAGIVVCNAEGSQSSVTAIPDNAGGIIILWQDARVSTSQSDIYMQRFNSEGVAQWAANGIPLVNSTFNENGIEALTISGTRFAAVWRDGRNGNLDLYANYFLIADGSRVNATDIAIAVQPNTQTRQVMTTDDAGGFIVVWEDPRISTTNSDLYIQRVNAAGDALWGANGTAVVTAVFNQLQPAIAKDGAGGAVVVWTDNRLSATDQNLYAQRFNAAGAAQWTPDGIAVVTAAGNQNNALIINDGSTNSIVSWSDNRVSTNDRNIFAQKINSNGELLWSSQGETIANAPFNQPNAVTSLKMVSDSTGGAIIVWDDNRANNTTSGLDIYGQRITGAGVSLWTKGGQALADRASSNQRVPVLLPSVGNRAIVTFLDGRSGTANGGIYASQIEQDGTLPVSLLTFTGTAAKNKATLRWETSGEYNINYYQLEKGNSPAQLVSLAKVKARNATGKNIYQSVDENMSKGDNFYRLKVVEKDGSFSYSPIVRLVGNGGSSNNALVLPNPTSGKAWLKLTNLSSDTYQLRMTDAAGRIVLTRQIKVQGAVENFAIEMGNLSNGLYRLIVADSKGSIIETLAVQKR